jgi:hypothetical protein
MGERKSNEMIKVFLHIATMGQYQIISDELINLALESGLIDDSEFHIGIVGDGELNVPEHENIKIHKLGRIDEFEFPTLQLIEDVIHETDENIKILYFSGLGVTNNSEFKKSWRAYLTHFVITHYKKCLEALDNFDVCGVDWRTNPVPHYSGNFWWANSKYLKTLPKIQTINKPNSPRVLTLRHNAEMYIGMNPEVNPRVLHQSNVSQYERHLYTYPEDNYLNKISGENIIRDI